MDGLGNGRSDRCRDPGATARRVCPRLPGGDGCERHRAGGDGELSAAPSTCWSWGGSRRSAWPAPLSSGRCSPCAVALVGPAQRARPRLLSPITAVPLVGTPELRPLAAGAIPRVRGVVHLAMPAGAPPRPRASRTESDGGWRPTAKDAWRHGRRPHSHGPAHPAPPGQARLECPVLVVHGDRDKITPPRDGRALARLADAQLEKVHGAGHFLTPARWSRSTWRCATSPRTPAPRDPTTFRPDGRQRRSSSHRRSASATRRETSR